MATTVGSEFGQRRDTQGRFLPIEKTDRYKIIRAATKGAQRQLKHLEKDTYKKKRICKWHNKEEHGIVIPEQFTVVIPHYNRHPVVRLKENVGSAERELELAYAYYDAFPQAIKNHDTVYNPFKMVYDSLQEQAKRAKSNVDSAIFSRQHGFTARVHAEDEHDNLLSRIEAYKLYCRLSGNDEGDEQARLNFYKSLEDFDEDATVRDRQGRLTISKDVVEEYAVKKVAEPTVMNYLQLRGMDLDDPKDQHDIMKSLMRYDEKAVFCDASGILVVNLRVLDDFMANEAELYEV